METHTIAQIAEHLRHLKTQNKKCTLMIGAGCSVEAGIPAGAGFVERIARDFPEICPAPSERSYAKCMAAIGPGPARDLIAEYVDRARINWAHVAIAQLMKHGYVDRTLTTNFDPLIVRACALIDLFPAVYDLAASPRFEARMVPSPPRSGGEGGDPSRSDGEGEVANLRARPAAYLTGLAELVLGPAGGRTRGLATLSPRARAERGFDAKISAYAAWMSRDEKKRREFRPAPRLRFAARRLACAVVGIRVNLTAAVTRP